MDNWSESVILDVETEAGDSACPKPHSKSSAELRSDSMCFVVTELQQQMLGESEAHNVCGGTETSNG